MYIEGLKIYFISNILIHYDWADRMCLDPDFSPDEQEEKARLISQVLQVQVQVQVYLQM